MDTSHGPPALGAGHSEQPLLGLPDTQLAQALQTITHPELQAPDVSVTCIRGTLERGVCFPAEGPAAFSITLALEGYGRTRIDGIAPLEIEGGMAAVFWSDRQVSGVDEVDGGCPIETVEIRFRPAYVQQTVGSLASVLRNALLVDRSDPSSSTVLVGLPLTAALIEVARGILSCSIEARPLREIYLRAKAQEALALVIEALSKLSPRALHLSQRDRGKVAEARRLIDTALSDPWTIAMLAAAVDLSESKLKLGFREIMGTSVRTYLREVRIEHAAQLIAAGEPVTEAALAAGFQNLSHFSKVFREVKGLGPRQFAKESRARTP